MSAHDLDPAKVLRLVHAMGGGCRRTLIVAREPLSFGDEEQGAMGLSEPVAAAIDRAVAMVEDVVQELLEAEMVR